MSSVALNDAVHEVDVAPPTVTCGVHVWLIGNPASGGGSGRTRIAELTELLEREAGSIAHVHHLTSSALPSDLRLCCPASRSSPTPSVQPHIPFSVAVIETASAEWGPGYVAARVADCVVRDRLDNHAGHIAALHVVLVVGGDGSLGEVVDGLCHGTLRAYARECHDDALQTLSVSESDDAARAGWCWRRCARAVLRKLLPALLYIPSGTGADFARLQLCCRTSDEVQGVLRGLREHLHALPCPTQTSEEEQTPSCACYEVDIGRVHFLRSRHTRHFVNVCSLGMSCDVVRRSERLRRHRLSWMAGGRALFALASIESLLATSPQSLRIARLSPCLSIPDARRAYTPRPAHLTRLPEHLYPTPHTDAGLRDDLRHVRRDVAAVDASFHVTCEVRRTCEALHGTPSTNRTPDDDLRAALDLPCASCGVPDAAACAAHAWVSLRSSTLAFGNGRWYGGGMHVTPHADPTDGLLSGTNWVTQVLGFLSGVRSLYNGRHTAWPTTTTFDGERFLVDRDVTVEQEHAMPIEVEADGQLLGSLPAVVEVASSVCFLVPREVPPFGDATPGSARAALFAPSFAHETGG